MAITDILDVEIDGRLFDDAVKAFQWLADDLSGAIDGAALPVGRELFHAIQRVGQEISRKHSDPWPGTVATNSPTLFRRTGRGVRSVINSITRKVGTGMNGQEVSISTGMLTSHETGATVRARKAKFLTIPLPAAMDGRGVSLRRRARDWENTFVARSRRGNLLIFQKRGRGIVPLYLLKPTTTHRPRLNLQREIDQVLPYFEARAIDILAKALGA